MRTIIEGTINMATKKSVTPSKYFNRKNLSILSFLAILALILVVYGAFVDSSNDKRKDIAIKSESVAFADAESKLKQMKTTMPILLEATEIYRSCYTSEIHKYAKGRLHCGVALRGQYKIPNGANEFDVQKQILDTASSIFGPGFSGTGSNGVPNPFTDLNGKVTSSGSYRLDGNNAGCQITLNQTKTSLDKNNKTFTFACDQRASKQYYPMGERLNI